MQSHDDSPFQEYFNNLSWHERAGLPDDRTKDQLIDEFVERAMKFFAIWNSMEERLSSHTPSRSRYARFADAVSDLLTVAPVPLNLQTVPLECVQQSLHS